MKEPSKRRSPRRSARWRRGLRVMLPRLDVRDAVGGAVEVVRGADEALVVGVAHRAAERNHVALAVGHLADRRVVVTGAARAAAAAQRPAVAAKHSGAAAAGFTVAAAAVEVEVAVGTLDRRARYLVGDDVDDAADGAGAVEQRRRAAHHFDAVGGGRIEGDAVIARLERQVAGAHAVLEDQHPVAVEAADHRAGHCPRRRSGR